MIINNKKILILPEYQLTDFPPQVKLSRDQAYNILMTYQNFRFDILVAGYVEEDQGRLYSSCLIIDDGRIFNIRKQHPYKEETDILTAWSGENSPIDLSIGRSYFLLCNDITVELKDQNSVKGNQNIENLFLISAMFYNFNEKVKTGIDYCKKFNIKRFITADRFNGIEEHTFNGRE
jgi:predicted amidohydrolase